MTYKREISRAARIGLCLGLLVLGALLILIDGSLLSGIAIFLLVERIDNLWWDAIEKPWEEEEDREWYEGLEIERREERGTEL